MKKLILVLLVTFLLGCENLSNTPIRRVEATLKKYQTLDSDVVLDLDEIIDMDASFTEEQKTTYKDIMKKQYQNMVYEIKDEEINGDLAIVTVEITVTDFNKVLDETSNYLITNPEEFNDEEGNYSLYMYNDYRLQQLKDAKEKVKYTLEIYVDKVDNEWIVRQFSNDTLDKINGVYNY